MGSTLKGKNLQREQILSLKSRAAFRKEANLEKMAELLSLKVY